VDTRQVPRSRGGLCHHQHFRCKPWQSRRIWHCPPDRGTGRGRGTHCPAGRRRLVRRRAGTAPLGARFHGPGHEAAHARPRDVCRASRHLPGQCRRPAARRCRRADRGDLPGPAAGQSGDHRGPPGHRRGHGADGRRRYADRPGDDRDHGGDAARLGDRRRADRARSARHRRHRPQLRDRAGRDERAPALSGRPRPVAAVLHAERRPARTDLGRGLLPGDRRPAGRRARGVLGRVRPGHRGRLLRDHAGAHG
jgi:hypothetical protein